MMTKGFSIIMTKGFSIIDSLIANFLWATIGLSLLAYLLKLEHEQQNHQRYRIALVIAEQLQEFLHFDSHSAHQIKTQLTHFSAARDCLKKRTRHLESTLKTHICQLIPKSHQKHLSFTMTEVEHELPLIQFQLSVISEKNAYPVELILTGWKNSKFGISP